MSTLSIRLSRELDARLSEESRVTNEPKSLLAREALERFLTHRSRERFLAKLTQAAVAVDPDEAVALADEALIPDNESLALSENQGPAGERDMK